MVESIIVTITVNRDTVTVTGNRDTVTNTVTAPA